MQEIYLDNSATTKPYAEVSELMGRLQQDCYGNPSSMHRLGLEADRLIGEARRSVAACFGGDENEIIFTSGGTEANNLAIKGAVYRNRRRGNHLVAGSIEHPSVLNCFRFLEREGFRASYLPVDGRGLVDPGEAAAAVGEDTLLVSIMHVNNEIGSIQPLREIGRAIKNKNPKILFHVDAVQSFARLPLKVREWEADLASSSGHKIHGPKGVGCLWAREGTLLQPLLHGGDQERGMRSGTENTTAIAAFGLAARMGRRSGEEAFAALSDCKMAFWQTLQSSGVSCLVNGPEPEEGAPHIINISFPGLKAEVLLHALEQRGIYVSAGSACHSRRPGPSRTLISVGATGSRLESALRFSFSCFNSQEEARRAARETAAAAKQLRSFLG